MTSWLDVLISVVVAILQIAVGVGLALFSVTLSLNLLNRLTRGLDEMAELRKGNVAVGVYIAGILIAVSSVIGQGASGIARSFLGGKGALEALIAGLIQLFIGLPLAIFSITLAQNAVYRFMVARLAGKVQAPSIAEELSRGNIAIAAILFGAFFATSTVISQSIGFLAQPIAQALGVAVSS
ncbi:MAG: hypothetical protein RQ855_02620 [Desulfurococcales archaeon]|jgi:uncharacterized membrane protein YjfL (UPF0719 family)|nr:hypothetical protein [Desulfurococcales archaeon]